MNFLPYVAALLIILAITSQPLVQMVFSDQKIHSSYQGHMNASRIASSLAAKNSYKQIPKEASLLKTPAKPLTPSQKPKTVKPLHKEKEKIIKPQKQMVNIAPLLQEGKEARPTLYSFMTHLILHLYEKELLFAGKNAEKTAKALVDGLIESSQKQKEVLHFEKLELKQRDLQRLFYKMLKGTKPLSNAHAKQDLPPAKETPGVPSLYEYIYCSLSPKEDHISIVFANPAILTALFNAQTAEKILQTQEKTKSLISKATLEKIFHQTHFSATDDLWETLDFSQKKSNLPFEIASTQDKETHIFLTRKNYLSSKNLSFPK